MKVKEPFCASKSTKVWKLHGRTSSLSVLKLVPWKIPIQHHNHTPIQWLPWWIKLRQHTKSAAALLSYCVSQKAVAACLTVTNRHEKRRQRRLFSLPKGRWFCIVCMCIYIYTNVYTLCLDKKMCAQYVLCPSHIDIRYQIYVCIYIYTTMIYLYTQIQYLCFRECLRKSQIFFISGWRYKEVKFIGVLRCSNMPYDPS